MSHRSHEMHFTPREGWFCDACPFATAVDLKAIEHSVVHQFRVAPPKPIERPRRRR
jgi:hypothetical protein